MLNDGKLHSQITISDFVGFFFAVELDGEIPRSEFEEDKKLMVKNAPKIVGDEDAAGITSLVSGVKNSRRWNGLEFDQVFYDRSRMN